MRASLPRMLMCTIEERKALMRVALGLEPADMVITNASLVNVYTAELMENCPVAVKGKWIASVGPDAATAIGKSTAVLDAAGKTLIPGLIEGHTHLSWFYNTEAFLPYAIRGGTTTVVTETMEPFAVAGLEGVMDLLDSFRDQPVKILATAPAMISISRSAHGIPLSDLERLLEREEILGLGESYWQAVLQTPEVMMPLFQKTLEYGKSLEGHSAGARGKRLLAYSAVGVSSCHEPIQVPEVMERLRLGMRVMVREGSVRRDLDKIAEIQKTEVDLRRLLLVTDSVEPQDLMEQGYLEAVVQKAIDCGFDPIQAVQMTTLNVAEHFGLDSAIGGIAPGRCADMVVIPDVRTIAPEVVISNGRIVFQEGKLTEAPRKHHYAESSLHTVRLPRALSASDFDLLAEDPSRSSVKVRVIEMVTDLVTTESHVEVSVVGGKISVDLERDLLKVAAVDRRHHPGRLFVGLIKGFQMKKGAMACSASWDTTDIVVVGANEEDMALAVNRVHALQGGLVVCSDGAITAELALPIFGVMSELPMGEVAENLRSVRQAAKDAGFAFADAAISLATLTCAAIPYLRICEEGLVNLKDGRRLPLEVQEPR